MPPSTNGERPSLGPFIDSSSPSQKSISSRSVEIQNRTRALYAHSPFFSDGEILHRQQLALSENIKQIVHKSPDGWGHWQAVTAAALKIILDSQDLTLV